MYGLVNDAYKLNCDSFLLEYRILIVYSLNFLDHSHFGIAVNMPSAGNFFRLFKSYLGMISIKKSKI